MVGYSVLINALCANEGSRSGYTQKCQVITLKRCNFQQTNSHGTHFRFITNRNRSHDSQIYLAQCPLRNVLRSL